MNLYEHLKIWASRIWTVNNQIHNFQHQWLMTVKMKSHIFVWYMRRDDLSGISNAIFSNPHPSCTQSFTFIFSYITRCLTFISFIVSSSCLSVAVLWCVPETYRIYFLESYSFFRFPLSCRMTPTQKYGNGLRCYIEVSVGAIRVSASQCLSYWCFNAAGIRAKVWWSQNHAFQHFILWFRKDFLAFPISVS